MESNGDITLHGKNISIIGDVTIKESAPKVDIAGSDEAKLGVGNQNIVCDKSQTGISGAAINSSAKGTHEITGALVKIN
jgi:type VI secretion system secreted protein VgrG